MLGSTHIGHAPVSHHGSHSHSVVHLIGDFLRVWRDRITVRHQLAELDDHMLADIGVSRWDVNNEVQRPFWQSIELNR